MPLGLQVVLAVSGLLSLVAVCVLIAVLLVLGLRNDQKQLNDRNIPYANAIAAAALNAKGIANDERGYLLTADPKFTTQMDGRIRRARAAFTTAATTADSPAQYRALVVAQAGFERWIDVLRDQLARFRAGDREGSTAAALGPGRAIRKRYEASLADAQALADHALQSGRTAVSETASRSVTILLASLLVTVAIGLALAVWLTRTILRPVYTLLSLFGETPRTSPSGQ
jgi:methyl-accepting chemotaxis protein